MEDTENSLPKANSIFRNQPDSSFYNVTFGEDIMDTMFLALNDIDKEFLEPEYLADKRGFDTLILKDPRTKLPLRQFIYDHTPEAKPVIFHSPKCSALSKAQHSVGVRVVKARQQGLKIAEKDFLIWHKTEKLRLTESKQFAEFVYEYNQKQKEHIYRPLRNVLDQYKKWYRSKCECLLRKYPPETFNTHLGLPHVKVCRAVLKDRYARIVQVDILKQLGDTLQWNSTKKLEFVNFHRSLEVYVDDYIHSEDLRESLEEQLKQESLELIQHGDPDIPMYFIPMETLMFLLTTGDYCDLPTEVKLDIKEHEGHANSEKYIIMDSPIPTRHLGWHTHKQVVEMAVTALLSYDGSGNAGEQNMPEIKSKTPCYKVSTFEDYLASCTLKPEKKCKFSQTLSKWNLKASDSDVVKHIYTTSSTVPEQLGAYSLKLEYKPTFGCELMTHCELLTEWFKLKLQQETNLTCFRLDINSFQTVLEEKLSLAKLELLLHTVYKISIPLLLSNFYEFLTRVSAMTCGSYLLRYNPKYKEKILLCKPSSEITRNTIHIHQLLRTETSELVFMSQPNYLPIADDLCSRVHMAHNILPCTFAPADVTLRHANKKNKKQTFKLINDEESIAQRVKNKRIIPCKIGKAPSPTKGQKKARKRKQLAKSVAEKRANKVKEVVELVREMEIDEQILGF